MPLEIHRVDTAAITREILPQGGIGFAGFGMALLGGDLGERPQHIRSVQDFLTRQGDTRLVSTELAVGEDVDIEGDFVAIASITHPAVLGFQLFQEGSEFIQLQISFKADRHVEISARAGVAGGGTFEHAGEFHVAELQQQRIKAAVQIVDRVGIAADSQGYPCH